MEVGMNSRASRNALNSYKAGVVTEVEEASPHRLIQLLFEGALQRIAVAKGLIQRREIEEKGNNISRAITIVGGLRASLDMSQGEIAQNLDNLYEYIERRLLEANLKNDELILDEVSSLLRDIKVSWDAIG